MTVNPVPVSSVEVTPNPSNIIVGQTVQLTAIPRDNTGKPLSGRLVAWRSGAPGLASVSSGGLVTGLQPGTAIIIATVDGVTGSGTVTVRIPPVATVTVSPSTANLTVGAKTTLTATLQDASGNTLSGRAVSWSSSDDTRATVTSGGEVTAVAPGTVTITAASEGQVGSATVTIGSVPVAAVHVNPTAASVDIGVTVQLSATTVDANDNPLAGRTVTWTSSADNIATVSSGGVVTGVGAGVATITATSEGKTGTSTITVNSPGPPPPVPVASVVVSPSTMSLQVGESQQASATTLDGNGNTLTGRTVTWSTGNANVATVTSSGVITANGTGTTTVTATSEGKSGSVTVNVAAASVNTITISPSPVSVFVNWDVTLTATARDDGGAVMTNVPVAWASSDATVAVVSPNGVVTGKAPGTAQITASSGASSGSVTVTVQLAPVHRVVVSPNSPTIRKNQTVQLAATLYDSRNNVLSGRSVSWSSADTKKVTVSNTGLATGREKGSSIVTATSEGVSGSTEVKVR